MNRNEELRLAIQLTCPFNSEEHGEIIPDYYKWKENELWPFIREYIRTNNWEINQVYYVLGDPYPHIIFKDGKT